MRRLIEFILLVAGTFYLALIYNSRGLVFLAYAEIFIVLLGLFCNLMTFSHLHITLEAPMGITEKGKRVPIKIRIDNYSILPTGKIQVRLLENYFMSFKKRRVNFYTSVGGRKMGENHSTVVIHIQWKPLYTGKAEIKICRARSFDLFGTLLLPLPKKHYLCRDEIMIMPPFYPIPIEVGNKLRGFLSEQEAYARRWSRDEEQTEQFQVRGYQPGDRIRSIHWKLSAKEDELMVREYIPVIRCPVLLFLEGKGIGKREWKKNLTKRESFFTVLVSLSDSLIQSECSHYVIWYDDDRKDVMRCRIKEREDIYTMLSKINLSDKEPEDFALEEEYYQKYREKEYAAKLVLSRNLQLIYNEETMIAYDAKRLAESLSSQEILLL